MSTPPHDRPRERLRRLGASPLSDRELLILVVGAGTRGRPASRIADGLLGAAGSSGLPLLARRSVDALGGLPGVGPALAARLVAAFELGRRAAASVRPETVRVTGPAEVAARMRPRLADLEQEEFHLLLLDRQHRIVDERPITRGILDASLIHPREVFRPAVEAGAAAILVVHNHPSGDPTPSAEDRAVTRQLREAGAIVGIPLLDHIVVARDGWRALGSEGG